MKSPETDGTTDSDHRSKRLLSRLNAGHGPDRSVDLGRNRQKKSLDMLHQALAKHVVENNKTPLGKPEADHFLLSAEEFLARLGDEGPNAQIRPHDEFLAEAIVETDGTRPAPLIRSGFIDLADPKLGDWRSGVARAEASIRRSIAATGRVLRHGKTDPDAVFGTAWMIATNLVATAQHVLESIAVFDDQSGQWIVRSGFSVDFSIEAGRDPDPRMRFRVAGVELPSPDTINQKLDLGKLDVAVLRLVENDLGEMPEPIALGNSALDPQGAPDLFVIGHPWRFKGGWVAETEAEAAADPQKIFRGILEQLLGNAFGVKRLSPGQIDLEPGSLPADVHKRVLGHDASTLEGNSGGPVLNLDGAKHHAIGLHFGGGVRKQNFALSLHAIHDHLALPGVQFG